MNNRTFAIIMAVMAVLWGLELITNVRRDMRSIYFKDVRIELPTAEYTKKDNVVTYINKGKLQRIKVIVD